MKNKRFIILVAALFFSMVVVNGLWAQTPPYSVEQSLSLRSTGLILGDVDKYIMPDAYMDVDFNNWFAWTSFDVLPTLGIATRFYGIYLGAYFRGSFFRGTAEFDHTRQSDPGILGGITIWNFTDHPEDSILKSEGPNNRIGILIGVADMGFGLSFGSTFQGFNQADIAVGGDYFKSYEVGYGYLSPQLSWGIAKDLHPRGIRPYLTVDLNFVRNYNKYNQYTSAAGTDTNGEQLDFSENYFAPEITLGLGGFNFVQKEGINVFVDLEYQFYTEIYDNEYSYLDSASTKYKTSSIKGYWDGTTPTELSLMRNTFTPSFGSSVNIGGLEVKVGLYLPFYIYNLETIKYDDPSSTVDNKLVKTSMERIFAFGLQPYFAFGVRLGLIPNTLTLNAGGKIGLSAVRVTTTESEQYDPDGWLIPDTAKTKTETAFLDSNNLANVTAALSVGITLNLSKNVWLEASTSANTTIFIFSNDNIKYVCNILIGLRF
jgi:hypothetical protein